MRFLADESCDFNVVKALRAAGFEIVPIAEVLPGATDVQVIELAVGEDRILLTEDKDFGRFIARRLIDPPSGRVTPMSLPAGCTRGWPSAGTC